MGSEKKKGLSRRQFLAATVSTAAVAAAKPAKALRPGPSASPNSVFRIHPAIGIARLGNADPSTFFIGPEAPGYGPLGDAPGTTVPNYKVNGLIKPQGARFRIFEYVTDEFGRLSPIQEINASISNVVKITWTVHLANKKASFHQFYGGHGEWEPPLPLRNASVVDRSSLENNFGPRSITGVTQAPVDFRPGGSNGTFPETVARDINGNVIIDYLGQLRTDSQGRLIVLGGKGKSASSAGQPIPTYANNDGWFDDVSDGPVTAVVTLRVNGQNIDIPVNGANGAWVLCTPPDFAPAIESAISQYDLHYDVALQNLPVPNNALYYNGGPLERWRLLKADFQPNGPVEFPNTIADFDSEIKLMLMNGYKYWWVTDLVTQKHDSLLDPALSDPSPASLKARQGVWVYIRPAKGATNLATGNQNMPKLLGDDPYIGSLPDNVRKLAFTRTQFGLLRNWTNGMFNPPTGNPPAPPTITPHGLDKAALENCVGGAFFPGIEASWQIRNPNLWAEPFRLNLNATSQYLGEDGIPIGPGHFSRQMAVPWQADFNDCRHEGDYGWWPAQRPDSVYLTSTNTRVDWARPDVKFASGGGTSTHQDMVDNWYKFGFVVLQGNVYTETERAPQIP